MAGKNTTHLIISNVSLDMNGYKYRCLVSEPVCNQEATSVAASLVVTSQNITVTLPAVNACPGTDISIPVLVDNFANVASVSLVFSIDPAVLTYTGYTLNPAMTTGLSNANSPAPYTQVILGWYSLNPVTLDAGSVMVTFHFSYAGGNAALTFNNVPVGNCSMTDYIAVSLPAEWINGSVNQAAETLVINTQPSNTSVNAGSSASFTCSSFNATNYEWQESANGIDWNNLIDGGIYLGTGTDHLTISNVTLGMNGYQYRCLVSGLCGNQFSESASLTVINNIPINVSLPQLTHCAGELIVPVTVSDFENAGSFHLQLILDNSLIFNGIQDIAPMGPGFGNSLVGNVLTIFYTSAVPFSIPNGVIFALNFTATAGTPSLVWDMSPGACYIQSVGGTTLPSSFNNGSITINPLPVVTWSDPLVNQPFFSTTYLLTGATPPGGTYSGAGVSGSNFNASLAGVGTHILTYTYTDVYGCTGVATNTILVEILPEVTWDNPLEAQCENSTTYLLSQGIPEGGTYSGPGVSGNNFNASLVGPGVYELTYSYTFPGGYTFITHNSITVNPLPEVNWSPDLPGICYYSPAFSRSNRRQF
ncbi:MAG: cohesin domain-containing protein [Bacteroidetes bacterium]|nr:cohesin domain-containing protein [Bacteroidota bacterium]